LAEPLHRPDAVVVLPQDRVGPTAQVVQQGEAGPAQQGEQGQQGGEGKQDVAAEGPVHGSAPTRKKSRGGAEAQRQEEKRMTGAGAAALLFPSLSSSCLCVSAPLREFFLF